MTADLFNPGSALHRLNFSAALPILIAMCMPDCPRPVPEEWLSFRIGRGEETVRKSLRYLQQELKLVFSVFVPAATKPVKAWWLANEVQQLPLPFVGTLRTGDTRPLPSVIESFHFQELEPPGTPAGNPSQPLGFIDDAGTPSPLDEKDNATLSAYLSATIDQTPKDNATLSPFLFSGNEPKDVITSGSEKKDNPTLSPYLSSRVCARIDLDLDPDLNLLDQDLKPRSDQDQGNGEKPKMSGYLIGRWLGIAEGRALRFRDVDAARPLGLYWFGMMLKLTTSYFNEPVGYVIKHLQGASDEHQQPYLDLAEAWLAMDTAQRQLLLDSPHDSRCLHRLVDAGYFIPVREWSLVMRATDGRVAPPELMPHWEEDEDEATAAMSTAVEPGAANVGAPTSPPPEPIPKSESESEAAVYQPFGRYGTANVIWKSVLGELELQMTKATFNTWLKGAKLAAVEGADSDGRVFVVAVKNDYAKDWIENRLADTIIRTASAIAEQRLEFRFIVSVN